MGSEFFETLIDNISRDKNFKICNDVDNGETLANSVDEVDDDDLEFDMFPVRDIINEITDKDADEYNVEDVNNIVEKFGEGEEVDNKEGNVKVAVEGNVDLNSLDGSDFLFSIESECYEDIISDDCLDSILESINTCNEEKESKTPVGCNVSKPESDVNYPKLKESVPENNDLVNIVPGPAFECDIVNNSDCNYTTENLGKLKTYVPNCDAYKNTNLRDEIDISTNKTSGFELTGQRIHLPLKVENGEEPIIINETMKSPRNGISPRDVIHKSNPILNLKQALAVKNKSIDELNNNIVIVNGNNCAVNSIMSNNIVQNMNGVDNNVVNDNIVVRNVASTNTDVINVRNNCAVDNVGKSVVEKLNVHRVVNVMPTNVTNDNCVVSNVLDDSGDSCTVSNVNYATSNFPMIQLKNAKLLDSQAVGLISGNCFSSVPVKKLKDANGLPSVVLYVKKSQVEELRKPAFTLNGAHVSSIVKSKEYISRNTVQPVEVSQAFNSISLVKPSDIVQTNNENDSCNTVGNIYLNVAEKKRLDNTQNSMDLPDKIKKPEPYIDKLLFSFSVNSRKLFIGTLNFETFQKNNDIIKYYTGIPKYSYFMALLHCLKLPVNNVVSPFQMLLLTLMKLRLNLEWMDLAYRFGKNVQVVQETFGITLYILLKCFSQLVCWSYKENKENNYRSRKHSTLFVYSIKANVMKEKELKRIYVCLSANNHPVHYVSEAIAESECTNALDLLDVSGMMENLVVHDLVIFDKEIDYLPVERGRSALSVLSDDHDSFCTQPFVNHQNKLGKMEETVSEIQQFKFLYGTITCGWADQCCDKLTLFNNAVKVVCSIVNLCSVLPFAKNSVTSIMSERNTMNILIT